MLNGLIDLLPQTHCLEFCIRVWQQLFAWNLYFLLHLWVFHVIQLLINPFPGIFSSGTSVHDVDNVMDSLAHGRVTSFLTFPTLSKRSLKNKVWNPKHPLLGLGSSCLALRLSKGRQTWLSDVPWEWLVALWSALAAVLFPSHLLAHVCPPAPFLPNMQWVPWGEAAFSSLCSHTCYQAPERNPQALKLIHYCWW